MMLCLYLIEEVNEWKLTQKMFCGNPRKCNDSAAINSVYTTAGGSRSAVKLTVRTRQTQEVRGLNKTNRNNDSNGWNCK